MANNTYERYTTAKDSGLLDYPWRERVKNDIESKKFKSFNTANQTAKQFVIVKLDNFGFKSKITNLGCGVHKIEADYETV